MGSRATNPHEIPRGHRHLSYRYTLSPHCGHDPGTYFTATLALHFGHRSFIFFVPLAADLSLLTLSAHVTPDSETGTEHGLQTQFSVSNCGPSVSGVSAEYPEPD